MSEPRATSVAPIKSAASRTLAAAVFLLLAAELAVFWLNVGGRPLYSPDEGRYARASQIMSQSGGYLVPVFEGVLRFQKPPLIHWAQVASMRLFGQTEFAVRFPSALGTTLSAVAVFLVGWRLRDVATGAIAASLFMTMPLVVLLGRLSIIDPMLSFFLGAAFLCGYMAVHGHNREAEGASPQVGAAEPASERTSWRWLIGFWIFVALATLAKGPVGLIPVLGLMLWLVLCGQSRRIISVHVIPGLILAGTPLILWVAAVLKFHPEAYEVWHRELVDRFGPSGDHPKGFWYYIPVLLAGFFPVFEMLMPQAARIGWRTLGEPFRRRSFFAYLMIAGGVYLAIFQIMTGRLATYMLPLGVPLALAGAWIVRDWLRPPGAASPPRDRRPISAETGLWVMAIGSTVLWVSMMAVFRIAPLTRWLPIGEFTASVLARASLAAAVLPAGAWLALRLWRRRELRAWAMVAVTAGAVAAWAVILHAESLFTNPTGAAAMMRKIDQLTGGEPITITALGQSYNAIGFYGGPNVDIAEYPASADERPGRADHRWIIIISQTKWDRISQAAPSFVARFQVLGTFEDIDQLRLIVAEKELPPQ